MKCQHKHVLYTEMTPRYMTHVFEEGKILPRYDSGEYGSISNIVQVQCLDCGMDKKFDVSHKSCPKWLKALNIMLFHHNSSQEEES